VQHGLQKSSKFLLYFLLMINLLNVSQEDNVSFLTFTIFTFCATIYYGKLPWRAWHGFLVLSFKKTLFNKKGTRKYLVKSETINSWRISDSTFTFENYLGSKRTSSALTFYYRKVYYRKV